MNKDSINKLWADKRKRVVILSIIIFGTYSIGMSLYYLFSGDLSREEKLLLGVILLIFGILMGVFSWYLNRKKAKVSTDRSEQVGENQ